MAKRVQRLGHPAVEADNFVGFEREVTVNTTRGSLHVHDGNTAGGTELATVTLANARAATTAQDGKMTAAQVQELEALRTDLGTESQARADGDASLDSSKVNTVSGTVGHGVLISAGGQLQTAGYAFERKFAAGTKLVFMQAAAPTGWQIDASKNDRVLRINSTSGYGTGGSWVVSGLSGGEHTLTVSQMPQHNHGGRTGDAGRHDHQMRVGPDGTDSGQYADSGAIGDPRGKTTEEADHDHNIPNQGGNQPHSHSVTQNGSWRPAYVDGIICTKQ